MSQPGLASPSSVANDRPMSDWTPTRSTASTRSNGHTPVPPSRAYQHAFGNTTPISARKAGIRSPAQASPQVKQRLAELRKAKLAAAGNNNNSSGSFEVANSPTTEDNRPLDGASVRRPSSSASLLSLDSHLTDGRTPSPAASEITIELGIRSLDEEVEKAKKSGRLNIAGRSLEELPPLILDQLLPQSSIYHPSNAGPPKTFSSLVQKTANIDLSRPDFDDNAEDTDPSSSSTTPWWEMESLTTLKASNNELTAVPAALAGFESLEILDLHANKLGMPFPSSFGTLVNLTNLNLANNNIDAWPIEIMALVHLKVLDLSHNKISKFWGLEWKTDVIQRLKDLKRDNKRLHKIALGENEGDSSFDSVDSQSTAADSSAGEDFWSAFSAAPVKTRARAYMPTKTDTDYTVALPSLTSLNLAHNRLSADIFSAANIVSLPPALSCLDLSSNNISGSIPMSLFGSLSRLQKLYLANNGLDDAFFVPAPPNSGPIFPSLNQLDLSRNALDSLEHLEEVLKIPIERQAIYSGISTPTLLKAVSMPPPDAPRYQPLRIDLAGNFLREELPRRKQLRRAKRQDSCHDTEGTSISQNPEDTEPAAVLRLLDEVHQSITNRLREGQFGQDQLSTIKSLLELLQSATGVPKAEGPQAGISQVNTEQPAGQSLVNPLKESHPPLKSIMPEAAGSSRARRLRMQQEAQQWEPL